MDDLFMNETDNFEDVDRFEMADERFDMEYKDASDIKLPDEIRARFGAQGYYLKWVRFRVNETIDTKNIRTKMKPSEGFTFVRQNEFQPDELLQLGDVEKFQGGDIITNGDLVLMKVRKEKAEARRKFYQDRTREQSESVNSRIDQSGLSNTSRSTVRTGKKAHFRGNV